MKKPWLTSALVPGRAEPHDDPDRRAILVGLHLEAAGLAARDRPEAVRRWFVEARPIYRNDSRPALEAFRLYYLGALRRSRYQFRSAGVLLSAAAQLFSRAGEISNAANALLNLGEICQEAGWLAELCELRERLLAILPVDESTCPYSQPLLGSAVSWARQLGIPVENTAELAALLLSRRCDHDSCRTAPERSEPGSGAIQ
ncbi:MAG: hypothetical protein GY856_01635 [bacterium]|nr:hypothetical protein [bacterium]